MLIIPSDVGQTLGAGVALHVLAGAELLLCGRPACFLSYLSTSFHAGLECLHPPER